MSRRKKILWTLLVLVVIAAWYGYREFTRTNPDIAKVKPDHSVSAADLINQFETNDSSANKKYLGKVIETKGMIKEIEKDASGYFTVVLVDSLWFVKTRTTAMQPTTTQPNNDSTALAASLPPNTVRCSIDSLHQAEVIALKKEMVCTVRGICTGFNKDEMGLGSDVILNRCTIITNKN